MELNARTAARAAAAIAIALCAAGALSQVRLLAVDPPEIVIDDPTVLKPVTVTVYVPPGALAKVTIIRFSADGAPDPLAYHRVSLPAAATASSPMGKTSFTTKPIAAHGTYRIIARGSSKCLEFVHRGLSLAERLARLTSQMQEMISQLRDLKHETENGNISDALIKQIERLTEDSERLERERKDLADQEDAQRLRDQAIAAAPAKWEVRAVQVSDDAAGPVAEPKVVVRGARMPSASATGSKLVCGVWRDGKWGLAAFDISQLADAKEPLTPTWEWRPQDAASYTTAVWSPAGDAIAYVSSSGPGRGSLHILRLGSAGKPATDKPIASTDQVLAVHAWDAADGIVFTRTDGTGKTKVMVIKDPEVAGAMATATEPAEPANWVTPAQSSPATASADGRWLFYAVHAH
ncbi:MAG: hypothetical protein NT029_14935 [Armatimonadetes bacterium]|nr:hypothetical protein [Armatimonadota bacterium]